MKTPLRYLTAAALLLMLVVYLPSAKAANANPPDRMSYQGFLVDANAVPLGNSAPRNYDVIFRLYDVSQGGLPLWAEQQTVTVDKGYFSVLLGEGSTVGNESRPSLSAVFTGASVSDRFVGITVRGLGPNDVEIAPRLRMLTSPYAFLARNAGALVSDGGQQLVTAASGAVGILNPNPVTELDVNGTVRATTLQGQINATNVTTGTLHPDRVPNLDADKVATGIVNDARLSVNIPRLNETANNFSGNVNAAAFSGGGTIPIGGIIMWSGAINQIPAGWALCNGLASNGRTTPNLRDRFIVGAGSTYAIGNTGGNASVTLSISQLPSHSHTFTDRYFAENDGNNQGVRGSGDTDNDNHFLTSQNTTASAGLGQPFDNRPPYYALAFIMRVQ